MQQLRIALGIENMQFQGLHYGPDHPRLRRKSCKLLQHLAGNAMDFRSLSCVFLAAVRTAAMVSHAAAHSRLRVSSPATQALVDLWASDDED